MQWLNVEKGLFVSEGGEFYSICGQLVIRWPHPPHLPPLDRLVLLVMKVETPSHTTLLSVRGVYELILSNYLVLHVMRILGS